MAQPIPSTTGTAAPGPAPSATGTTADDRSEAFRPVTGGAEMQSGEMLLVEAYAAFWLLAIAMIVMSMRRQKQLEARIERLGADVARAREQAPGRRPADPEEGEP